MSIHTYDMSDIGGEFVPDPPEPKPHRRRKLTPWHQVKRKLRRFPGVVHAVMVALNAAALFAGEAHFLVLGITVGLIIEEVLELHEV